MQLHLCKIYRRFQTIAFVSQCGHNLGAAGCPQATLGACFCLHILDHNVRTRVTGSDVNIKHKYTV